MDGKDQHQHNAQPEIGDGQSQLGSSHDHGIAGTVVVAGSENPQGQGYCHGDQHGHEGQGAGHRQAGGDQRYHRQIIGDGAPAAAAQQAAQPLAVLNQEGLVQSQPAPQGREGFGRRRCLVRIRLAR